MVNLSISQLHGITHRYLKDEKKGVEHVLNWGSKYSLHYSLVYTSS